jgi:hypothetical protein
MDMGINGMNLVTLGNIYVKLKKSAPLHTLHPTHHTSHRTLHPPHHTSHLLPLRYREALLSFEQAMLPGMWDSVKDHFPDRDLPQVGDDDR